ncbi:alpha/beta fold hydrolase [Flexithrix dorotheae]|uniref:alpha/beta fold hydrolase n=1 Tax=Flexithrix dorotheae TaxID=70993 RepID=UPI00037C316B|nr:alpha/beta hydrolase [Flexithrix dorotheae]
MKNYSEFGNGEKVLLAFHGFGQDGSAYEPLAKLKPDYKIYSFDLYFHGKSYWNEEKDFLKPKKLKKAFKQFFQEEGIKNFELIGFSMGCRSALALLKYFPKKINKITLIAPDGIKENFWYRFAIRNSYGQKIFSSIIANPAWCIKVLDMLKNLRIIPAGQIQIAKWQLEDKQLRDRIFYTWRLYRYFQFNFKKIGKQISKNKVEVEVILGDKDFIITEKHIQPLVSNIKNYKLSTIPSNHFFLIANYIKQLPQVKSQVQVK